MIDPVKAYIAGMLDANGHIVWRDGKINSLSIFLLSTSEPLIYMMQTNLGGVVSKYKLKCNLDCTLKHDHRRLDVLKWQISGERAAIILKAIKPFLILKYEVAMSILKNWEDSYLKLKIKSRRDKNILIQRQELERLGWLT